MIEEKERTPGAEQRETPADGTNIPAADVPQSEDKTNEKTSKQAAPEAAAPEASKPTDTAAAPAAPKRALREWIAEVQCWVVRKRHHVNKATTRRKHALLGRLAAMPMYTLLGEWLYALGFMTEYCFVRAGRALRAATLAAGAWLRVSGLGVARIIWRAVKKVLGEFFGPVYVFLRGVRNLLVYSAGVRRQQGFGAAVKEAVCYLGRGIRRYAKLVPAALSYIVPAAALFVFVTVVHTVMGYQYTLAVQVNGRTVGYVASETVFDAAKEAVDERIDYAGTTETSWDIQPTYTLSMASDVMDENAMADAILYASSDELSEATALYLDGALYAVTADSAKLRSYFSSLTAPYEDPDDPLTSVKFNRDIELVDGVFFTDSLSEYNSIVEYLSGLEQAQVNYTLVKNDSISLIASKNGLTMAQLMEYNPGLTLTSALFPGNQLIVGLERRVLEVQIVRTVTREEAIAYSTKTTESSEYAYGVTKTITEGQNGLKSITEQITYDTEGNTLSTELISETVLVEPVTKEVIKGTKLPSGQIASYGSGSFRWPVPNYRYCSRWYGNGHRGVDICAPAGTAILASDSGVVVAAGYNAAGSGYGYSIIIDHGNGYRTLYAHCLSLSVSVGQSVSQGQYIAALGSTGRSTGNHCHFEIIKNGAKMPPQNWFGGM